MHTDFITHYDLLIDENNDTVRDPKILQEHMEKWDGQTFIDAMKLDKSKAVLEIGVGTGRLAIKVAPLCTELTGIDVSPKTIQRAKENLAEFKNVKLVCDDFLSCDFSQKFDVIYSSLTFMHIIDKKCAIEKIAALLNVGGITVISLDKNQEGILDYGSRTVKIYPDSPDKIMAHMTSSGLKVQKSETEFANIIIGIKHQVLGMHS